MCKDFSETLSQAGIASAINIKLLRHGDVAKSILHGARSADLVILYSTYHRIVGGLAVGDFTRKVSSWLETSIVVFNKLESE